MNYASVLRELLRQTSWFVDVANLTFLKIGLHLPEEYAKEMMAYRGIVVKMAMGLPALFPERTEQPRIDAAPGS